MSPAMGDLDDTDNAIKAEPESDDELEVHPHRKLMAQAAGTVKRHRSRPRKPRKKALQPPDGPPQVPDESPFMTLPPEIRNVIYELAIRDYHDVMLNRRCTLFGTLMIKGRKILTGVQEKKHCHISIRNKIPVGPGEWPEPGLLLMSRQVRAEARPLYYSLSKFQVFARPHELRGVSDVLNYISASLEAIPGRQWPIKKLRISLVDLKWANVHLLLPLAQMCMKYPIGVDHRGQSLGYVIEELQELARRGHREQWADEWMEFQFEAWLERLPGSKEKRQHRSPRFKGSIQESYIQKAWLKMQKCEELPGDTYGLRDEDEEDSDFNGSRRNVPTSDRKLRSMS